jgi:hypothetical protein
MLLGRSGGGSADPAARQRLCVLERMPVKSMTLRQLKDTVHNLQVEWVRQSVPETMQPDINEAVDALFHRYEYIFVQ